MKTILSICFLAILLAKSSNAQNQIWSCIVCKESDYPGQCGAVIPNGLKLPTVNCSEACVTYKNAYDGGCIKTKYLFFFRQKLIIFFL